MKLARCKRLTDKALCSLADFLWIEGLDVSHNSRITDDGIEVIAVEFSGIQTLDLSACPKVSDRSVRCLARHNAALRELRLLGMSRYLSEAALGELRAANHRLRVRLHKGDDAKDALALVPRDD